MWYRIAKSSSPLISETPLLEEAPAELLQVKDVVAEPLPPPSPVEPPVFQPPAAPDADQHLEVIHHLKDNFSKKRQNAPSGLAISSLLEKREHMVVYLRAQFLQAKSEVAQQYGMSEGLAGRLIARVPEYARERSPEWQAFKAKAGIEANRVVLQAQKRVWPELSHWYPYLMLEGKALGLSAGIIAQSIPPIRWDDIIDEREEGGGPAYESSFQGVKGRFSFHGTPSEGSADRAAHGVDRNYAALAPHLQSLLAANGLLGGNAKKAAAKLISIINHKPLSLIENEGGDPKNFEAAQMSSAAEALRQMFVSYFRGGRVDDFTDLLELLGQESLANAFEHSNADLDYHRWFPAGNKSRPDPVFGQDYGLETKSKAEQEIMEIFRSFGLVPVPQEMSVQSKANTAFKLDFLLPCEVLLGHDPSTGAPQVQGRTIFVGEYFGFSGANEKYDKRTGEKEELEPFQAAITGNDVIFIRKNDYSSDRLEQQLDAKGIIYEGSKAQQEVLGWMSEGSNHTSATGQELQEKLVAQSPDLNYIRVAMSQLEMYRGALADFSLRYHGDPTFKAAMHRYHKMYNAWATQDNEMRLKLFRLRRKLRKLTPSDSTFAALSAENEALTQALTTHGQKYRSEVLNTPEMVALRAEHQQILKGDVDYQARRADLEALLSMVASGDTAKLLAMKAQGLVNVPAEATPLSAERSLRQVIRAVCEHAVRGVVSKRVEQSAPFTPLLGQRTAGRNHVAGSAAFLAALDMLLAQQAKGRA